MVKAEQILSTTSQNNQPCDLKINESVRFDIWQNIALLRSRTTALLVRLNPEKNHHSVQQRR